MTRDLRLRGDRELSQAHRMAPEAGFEVRLVSSLALARTREALHNSWDKNDPKDAQVRRNSNPCDSAERTSLSSEPTTSYVPEGICEQGKPRLRAALRKVLHLQESQLAG